MNHFDRLSKTQWIKPRAAMLWSLITFFMVVYALWVPVHPDEAYYWTWSQHLALSYFDGPPLTAWCLRILTELFGTHAWTIKFIAVASVSASALLLYRLAVLLFDYEVAEKALIIFLLIPITQATNFITSLDPLLMFFWSLSLYLLWQWLHSKKLALTVLMGICLGLGFLAKYPMVLFLPSAFLILLVLGHSKEFLSYRPYLILMIFSIISLPVIVWNFENHWISLGFQWHHGTQSHQLNFHDVDMFLLAQMGALNPIYWFALIIFSIRYYKDYRMQSLQFLVIPTITVVCVFGYFGLWNRSQANWTMPAYLSASILLAYFFDKHRLSFTYWSGIALNILVILLLKFPYFSPERFDAVNPIIKFYGYHEVIDHLEKSLLENEKQFNIISDSYQDASEIELAIDRHPHVCIVTPTRESQTTLICRAFQLNLMKNKQTLLWIGPEGTLPLIQSKTEHCTIIATSHYRYRATQKNWIAAECSGTL
jgi:4-amino-4-deoxy-L-arabinose transferase-like glycosyltransferase